MGQPEPDINDLSFLLGKTASDQPDTSGSGADSLTSVPPPPVTLAPASLQRKRRERGTSNVIAVRLDSNGRIDAAHMRGETLERLKSAVGKSDLIDSAEEKSAVVKILVPAIYKVAGGLEGLLASYLLKVPRDDAAEVFEYTDAEIAILQEPTANVLAKYSGSWMFEHGDVLALVFHLAAIHQMKLEALKLRLKKPAPESGKVTKIS